MNQTITHHFDYASCKQDGDLDGNFFSYCKLKDDLDGDLYHRIFSYFFYFSVCLQTCMEVLRSSPAILDHQLGNSIPCHNASCCFFPTEAELTSSLCTSCENVPAMTLVRPSI